MHAQVYEGAGGKHACTASVRLHAQQRVRRRAAGAQARRHPTMAPWGPQAHGQKGVRYPVMDCVGGRAHAAVQVG